MNRALTVLFIVLSAQNALPKTLASSGSNASPVNPAPPSSISPTFIRQYETRLRPYFESRTKGPAAVAQLPASQRPRDADLMVLARLWDRLSPEFLALYKTATQIPDGYQMYISPGGHFEVYYTTVSTSPDAVSTVDTLGYGNGADWRPRKHGKNNIPDYVDEVAWALDSCWSMHVDRFAFIAPISYKDAQYISNRYRLLLTQKMGPSMYGQTFPKGKATGSLKGYSSYIELRNEWNGASWKALGYDAHPENGTRVTCAHELFHAVQYAMTWNCRSDSELDDFPLSWLEGTAVLMEELGFDYINDYVQYAAPYFNNPSMSFLGASEVYTNGILAKYIYEKATGAPRIDFIRQLFFTNYNQVTPFHSNLRATSLSFGLSWSLLLNRFHAASYFSGSKADTARFLADAPLLGQWPITPDVLPYSDSITKSVNAYSMKIFNLAPAGGDNDTVFFGVSCVLPQGDTLPYPQWAVSCILRKDLQPDSLFAIAIDNRGQGLFRINGWRSLHDIVVLITNGHPVQTRNGTVFELPCPVTYQAGETRNFISMAPDQQSIAMATLQTTNDVQCSLRVDFVPPSSMSHPSSLYQISSIFNLNYPTFWGTSASVTLVVSVPDLSFKAQRNSVAFTADSMAPYRYDLPSATWKRMAGHSSSASDTMSWRIASAPPGAYAIFAPEIVAHDSTAPLAIFPNPARLSRQLFMRFEGSDIREIRVYAADGSLVCCTRGATKALLKYKGGYEWRLVNDRGSRVVPGNYSVATISNGNKRNLYKVMVFP